MTAAMHYFQEIHADFGITSEADWSEFTTHSLNREANGTYTLHYDPAIGDAFEGEMRDVVLWSWYDEITCPTLLLRGANSDLLTREVAQQMTERGPRAELVEFPGCGHAPALIDEDQISVVHEFLMRGREEEEEDGEESGEGEAETQIRAVLQSRRLRKPRMDEGTFQPRFPWVGGDLQTIRNQLVSPRIPLDSTGTERWEVDLSDGSGDRLVVLEDRPRTAVPTRPLSCWCTA